jgi:capsular polysaccharide transport system permease protein
MRSDNRKKRSSLEVLKDVVFALFFRELKTRFGPYRLGLAWAFLEPISFVLILTAIRSIARTGNLFGGELHTIPFPIFFLLGYVPYQLFSKLLTQSAQAINANQGLFNYRQVRPIDAILARALLEILIIGSVILLFMAAFRWLGFTVTIDSVLQFITVFLLLALFSVGVGLVVCVGQLRFPELGKIIPIITRPLFFISGIFFSLNDIPEKYHYLLTWNPLLHAIELIRNGCYKSFGVDAVSIEFLAFTSLVVLFFGLALYRLDWKRMVAT